MSFAFRMKSIPRLAAVVVSVMLGLALAGAAWAMRVSPMVSEISTVGAGAAARIEVQNISSSPLPYETSITRVSFNPDGTISETPADDDFLVFPPQGIAAPGARQIIRAQWIGDPQTAASIAYYMEIRQLPVDFDARPNTVGSAAVQVVYHMKTLIIVAPPGTESSVQVLSAEAAEIERPAVPAATQSSIEALTGTPALPAPEVDTTPVPVVKVRLRNSGQRHAVMSGVTWILEGVDAEGKPLTVRLTPADIGGAVGVGYLPPEGAERVLTVPTGQKFGDGPIRVSFAG